MKNASGLSVPGPTAVWLDKMKSVEGLVDGGSTNAGAVDESYRASAVQGRTVEEGEMLHG